MPRELEIPFVPFVLSVFVMLFAFCIVVDKFGRLSDSPALPVSIEYRGGVHDPFGPSDWEPTARGFRGPTVAP